MSKTNFVINKKLMLDAESLIFAEIAAPGAMGAAGTVNLFILESGKIKHYSFNAVDTAEIKSYENCDKMFRIGLAEEYFDYEYAGYQNHAFKKHGVKFERDDDNATLIYIENKKRHKIKVSCLGVYSHILKSFANSPIDVEKIEEIVEKGSDKIDEFEMAFLKVYAEQCRRFEQGESWFDIDFDEYNDVISYIKFRHGENVEDYRPDEYTKFGIEAIQKYRLKYVVEKLGWNRLHRLMKQFLRTKKDLFKRIDEVLGEKQKISAKFMRIRKGKYDGSGIERLSESFEYPTIIDFDKETRKALNKEIIENISLYDEADDVAYYLMNYFWNLFDWGFDEIEPVVWHVIDCCPRDDARNIGVDKLFWIATHIINTYWKRLSGKENTEFEKKVLEHFARRVGGLWPLVHFNEFKMNDRAGQYILEESIGFIVSVEEELLKKDFPGIVDFLYTEFALKSDCEAIRGTAEKMQEKTS